MAGIDILLHESLGEDYRQNPAAVPTAEAMTADLMSAPRLCRGRAARTCRPDASPAPGCSGSGR